MTVDICISDSAGVDPKEPSLNLSATNLYLFMQIMGIHVTPSQQEGVIPMAALPFMRGRLMKLIRYPQDYPRFIPHLADPDATAQQAADFRAECMTPGGGPGVFEASSMLVERQLTHYAKTLLEILDYRDTHYPDSDLNWG